MLVYLTHFGLLHEKLQQQLKNLTPTFVLEGAITPFEAFYGRKPDLCTIRAFGCPVYAHIHGSNRSKSDDTSTRGIFIGYNMARRAYNVLAANNSVIVSRNVVFDEDNFVSTISNRANKHWAELKHSLNPGGESFSDESDSDGDICYPPSLQRPALTASSTPEPKTTNTPPVLEKKKSAKSVQRENAKKQEKLQRVMKDLSIDMNFSSAETDYMFTLSRKLPISPN